MNNIIARKIVLTGQYQPLAAMTTVASVTLSAPPSNSDNAVLLGDTGDEVPLIPGEWHEFKRINLAEIQVKGVGDDIITVVGGTW